MGVLVLALVAVLLLMLADRPRRRVHMIDSFDVPPPVPVSGPWPSSLLDVRAMDFDD